MYRRGGMRPVPRGGRFGAAPPRVQEKETVVLTQMDFDEHGTILVSDPRVDMYQMSRDVEVKGEAPGIRVGTAKARIDLSDNSYSGENGAIEIGEGMFDIVVANGKLRGWDKILKGASAGAKGRVRFEKIAFEDVGEVTLEGSGDVKIEFEECTFSGRATNLTFSDIGGVRIKGCTFVTPGHVSARNVEGVYFEGGNKWGDVMSMDSKTALVCFEGCTNVKLWDCEVGNISNPERHCRAAEFVDCEGVSVKEFSASSISAGSEGFVVKKGEEPPCASLVHLSKTRKITLDMLKCAQMSSVARPSLVGMETHFLFSAKI